MSDKHHIISGIEFLKSDKMHKIYFGSQYFRGYYVSIFSNELYYSKLSVSIISFFYIFYII